MYTAPWRNGLSCTAYNCLVFYLRSPLLSFLFSRQKRHLILLSVYYFGHCYEQFFNYTSWEKVERVYFSPYNWLLFRGRYNSISWPGRETFSSSPKRPHRLWGPAQHRIHYVPEAVFRGVKRPGRKADHSPPPNAGIKNAWLYLHSFIHLHVLVRN